MTERCGIRTGFMGVIYDECDQPATVNLGWSCPRGHAETFPVCADHRAATADIPVLCPCCAELGNPRVRVDLVDAIAYGSTP